MARIPLRDRRLDRGETLLELLIAVMIMGVAVVAIVGGIGTSIVMSDIHRKQATAGAYVRDYAEAVEKYVAAGNYSATSSPDYTPGTVGFSVPAGYTATLVSAQCWSDTSLQFGSCSSDSGVQKVSLRVATNVDTRASETLVVVVRKPCAAGSSCT